MGNKYWLFFGACAMVTLTAGAADAPAVAQAKELASTVCVSCHGVDGVSQVENFPNLAKQKATYLAKQLRDFRDGKRKDPVMSGMAASLNDETIMALAQIFSAGPKR